MHGKETPKYRAGRERGWMLVRRSKQAYSKTRKDGRTAPKMQLNQPRFYEKREAAENPEQMLLPQRWK